jgi:hypothetical protein
VPMLVALWRYLEQSNIERKNAKQKNLENRNFEKTPNKKISKCTNLEKTPKSRN